jgi:hypothetical protein
LMICGATIKRDVRQRFGPGAREASSKGVSPEAAAHDTNHDDAE